MLVFRETTERRQYERRSTAQHAVTSILSEAPSFAQAAPRLLETIGKTLQFHVGVAWEFHHSLGRAFARSAWRQADPAFEHFVRASLSFVPAKDEGLPGMVWNEKKSVFVAEDLTKLPRAEAAREAGLRCFIAFPILTERTVYGALEFSSRESFVLDPELQEVFHGLGRQIGQFIERKNSEEALAESEELYRAISQTVADGLIVIGEESEILMANSAVERIFGYTAAELQGQRLTALIPPRMHERHLAGMRRFIETGEKRISWSGVDLPGLRKDGVEIPLEISFGASKRGGKYIFTGLLRDVTERKKSEEAIRELNQELETRVERRTAALLESKEQMEAFTYTVAHDLRAPLRAMQGFAQALMEDYEKALGGEALDYLRRIMSASERMDILIQDLLEYSQLSRSDLKLQSVNLPDVIRAAMAEHEYQIADKTAVVEVDVARASVEAHPATLEHAFANLISNALKFTAPGRQPRIEIRAEPQPPYVRVSVRDNGIGIEPEHHERIFRVFERLHGQEAFPGTGIGLAIVKKGIERMGGRVGLESTPGEGSRFWIDLRQSSS